MNQIIISALEAAYQEIEKAGLGRKPTDAEKAIISCALTLALMCILEEPRYRFPNMIGKTASIFAFLIIIQTFNENDLPTLRRSLGLSQKQVSDSVHKAVDKINDEEYMNSSIRAVIIGTRLAIYRIIGMDSQSLHEHLVRCEAAVQFLTSTVGFAHLPSNLKSEATQLVNFMAFAMDNGEEAKFDIIFKVS